MTRRTLSVALLAALAAAGPAAAQKAKQKPIPVAKDVGPKDRDIQLGREVAQQVEQQMYIVPNKELTDYINRVGQRLVGTGLLDRDFPYTFKVVQEPSLNAFALPGGPMFVHTGLIEAAETEAQLAGVLAHELAHVSLRHGIANSSKQQTAAGIGQVAGAVLGGILGGALGQVAQAGAAMAGQGFAMKYSRGAESEADLLGAYTMAKAGYNPVELGRFFEKLEQEAGGNPGAVAQLMSSHPNPGNRSKTIEQQVEYMQPGPYGRTVGDLDKMRKIVQGLPPNPKAKGGAAPSGQAPAESGPMPTFDVSRTMKPLTTRALELAHPDNWRPQASQDGSQLVIAPQGGVTQAGIACGVLISSYKPRQARDLRGATEELVGSFVQSGQGQVRVVGQGRQIELDGKPSYMVRLEGPSPYQGAREVNVLVTTLSQNQVVYMVFVAPDAQWSRLEPVYQEMTRSVRFGGR
jgi:hypothetical protein